MKLGWNLTSNLNRNLTCWKSDVDPSIGDYTVTMDIQGDPQISLLSDSGQKWRSGTWNGIEFSGIPEMMNFSGFTFTFINNKDAVYYSYDLPNKPFLTRLVINATGKVQRYVWIDSYGSWSLFWNAPDGSCQGYSTCGPYGVCNSNASPICSCLHGFEPKSPADWALRDASTGCMRKTALDCRNGTDLFMKVSNVQLPDTSNATVDMDVGLEECRNRCLMNCSCTAYANADVRGGGSGCIIWVDQLVNLELFVDAGQDLYVRLAAADFASSSTSEESTKRKFRAIASACLTFGLLLCAIVAWFIWRRRRERKRGTITLLHSKASIGFLVLLNKQAISFFHSTQEHESNRENEDVEMPLFDFAELVAATNNFSPGNKLGEGGFGPVYKGETSEGQEIAVKRLAKTSLQGTEEFKNEVTLIAKLQHRNLVQILGCCIQGEERMLVYEYMPNNSLDFFLFDKDKSSVLDWEMRYRIINGIARGLLYLHQDSRFRIIHRDLKASNILLDRNMNPKISDFGMARIFGGDETMTRTQKVVGTYGYMSPEYAMDGIFSVKSDVFSFGVLILEIISGQKNRGVYLSEPHLYLLGKAWRLWNGRKSLELIDPSMGYSFSVTEVVRCIKVGLLCVQEFPQDRPTISSAVLMLGSDEASVPEPKRPGFLALKAFSDEQGLHSVNDVTISITTGR
ncbi:receptor-like serine/threonine-protein kinase SD1-8 isoform X1 [Typha latifolia]|uniref:receptor-like serine/threonine-protein kinase SD1-8 isoform X1 n=1 Tax=Typha latifolia TaxID=4733 RepID=UPI003C2B7BB0